MKIVIVCTFDTCFDRVNLLRFYYQARNNEVIVITSDFSHRNKKKYVNKNAEILINVKPYQKNLSFDRLQSHYGFAKKVENELMRLNPDLIHAFIPANSLAKFLTLYKRSNPSVRLIYDIIDLWPETLPINRFKHLFPFTIWKNLRDKYIEDADIIFTECEYYQNILNKETNFKYHTLYWSKQDDILDSKFVYDDSEIVFCYLGSINNIIDIDLIVRFLHECKKYKPVSLHIIGKGESKESFINKAILNGIKIFDHKEIYVQEEKQAVFDLCDYGLNIMKQSVIVGLTMKSLDYMCGGLPLINTIKGDTKFLCEKNNIGVNLSLNNIEKVAYQICNESEKEQRLRRKNIRDVYTNYFSKESFFKQLDNALKNVGGGF